MTERPRVLVTEPLSESGLDLLRADFDVADRPELAAEGLADAIGSYDALIVRSQTKVTAEVLERAERLRVVGRAGIGLDNVDVDAATRRGVMVVNAPQANIVSAAEHTIALLLAQARNIPQAHAALSAGRWERSRFQGVELHGKTLGVLGLDRVVVTPHLGASTQEAQDKAGADIAEMVRLALRGEFVPYAVNVPAAAEVSDVVRPFLPLAEKLGALVTGLAEAGVRAVEA